MEEELRKSRDSTIRSLQGSLKMEKLTMNLEALNSLTKGNPSVLVVADRGKGECRIILMDVLAKLSVLWTAIFE